MDFPEGSPLLQLRSKGTIQPRRGTMFSYSKKGLNLRPDSPKTREACLALGFDPSIFKLKKIDEFGGPNVPENVQKMRYDHYTRKMEAAFKEIAEVRKQITKKNKGLQNIQLEESFHRDETLANDMIETYNKKMTSSVQHHQNIKDEEVDSYESFDENDPVLVLEDQLEREVRKYKRALAVKAKEVQHQLENEKRRFQLQQEMEQKEHKLAELHEKMRQLKAQKKKQHQQLIEKKFTNIKNKEKQFNEKQISERKRQLERFEELSRKLKFDEDLKKKEMEDHEKQQQVRFDIVKTNKKRFDKVLNDKMTHTLSSLQTKCKQNIQLQELECSSNKERFTWECKLEKLTMRSTHYEEKLRRIRQQTEQKEADAIQKVVGKLLTKEQELFALDKQKQQQEQSKLKEEATKRKRVEKQLERIQSLQLQRVSDLEKRFIDLEEYSSRRREDIDHQKNLKKEKMKMKQQDLIENYQRQERLKDLRFKQVIKDNQQLNEQKSLEKLSLELVRKAQQELQRKLKQENELLDRSLMSVSQADSKLMRYKYLYAALWYCHWRRTSINCHNELSLLYLMNSVQELFLQNENHKFAAKLLSQYRVISFLGKGAFSSVFKVFHEGEFYAIKIVDKGQTNSEKLQQEAIILSKLLHPNIVHYHNTLESKRKLYFILQFIEGQTLQQFLENSYNRLSEKEATVIIRQLVDVLSYIHSKGIIHRDLKLENIILDRNFKITLIDFGLSYQITQQVTTHQNCGTLIFMAPEVLMGKEYFKSVDIWSCGIIQYYLLKKHHPFWKNHKKETFLKLMRSQQKADYGGMSKSAISFFEKTAAFEPEARITAGQALQHPWITGVCSEIPMTSKEIILAYRGIIQFVKFLKAMLFLQYLLKNCEKVQQSDVTIKKRILSKQSSPRRVKLFQIPTRSCLHSSTSNDSSRETSLKPKLKLPPIRFNIPKATGSPSSHCKTVNQLQTTSELKKSHFRFK